MSLRVSVIFLLSLIAMILGACSRPYPASTIDPSLFHVIVNPYTTAPLVALLDIEAAAGVSKDGVHRIEITLTDPKGGTVAWTLPFGTAAFRQNFDTSDLTGIPDGDLVVPVLGLAPDAPTRVSARIVDDRSHRVFLCHATITAPLEEDAADPLRDGYPAIAVTTPPDSPAAAATTMVSFSMGDNGFFITRPFFIDAAGAIRWVLRLDSLVNWASPVERLQNGNLILGRGEHVYEYSMLGRQVHIWDIGRYGYTQHHDIIEITQGRHKGDLLVAVDRSGASMVEDVVIEIDRSGVLVDTWDMRQLLDVSRGDLLKNASDWFHMNALWYDGRDDTLLVSGRNQGVAKVDRDHEVRWILAPHQGWGVAGPSGDGPDTSRYLLTAVSPSGVAYPDEVQQGHGDVKGGHEFDWPWGQHAVSLLANRDIFLFDNGFNRMFQGHRDGYSRAVEYRVDEKRRQVRQVWQYGGDRGPDFYSDIISDVDVITGSSNRLITSGSIRNSSNGPHAYVTEVTYPAGKVVFEARIAYKDAHSDLKAGGWGNMDIVYRAERMPLYPGLIASAKAAP